MKLEIKRLVLTPFDILFRINKKLSLELMIWLKHKKWPNLNEPKTYIEKLNWMKLHYRNDLMPKCADKYHARSYIEEHGYVFILFVVVFSGINAPALCGLWQRHLQQRRTRKHMHALLKSMMSKHA